MPADETRNSLVKTTCCYCGVGCGMLVETESIAGKLRIKHVEGDPDHPANWGRLCSKGATLHLTAQPHVYEQTRARHPEWRQSKSSPRSAIQWDQANELVASRFAEIIHEHGPDAVAFYVSGQILTEDYYIFNKLAKGLIGTNNIDTNSRLCMSSAVAGYKRSLGADAPPCTYEDIDHATVLFITGSNAAYAHPILFRRIEAAKEKNPDLKIVVVDPRRTDTAQAADLFLQILPGTDMALYHGMLHLMLWEGWLDQEYIEAHTEGFSDLKALVKNYPPKTVAQLCGISEADLFEAARLFATSTATLSLYCQGLNQSTSGTAKNSALINLHLATGQIGKAGAGPFSLTGQPNAMGGREVGGLANQLAAHRDLNNPTHRQEVADFWGVTEVSPTPGLTAVPMFEALRSGRLKAIWIVCTNPAQSLPDQTLVHQALEAAEFVVLQEAYAGTATAAYADVLLPATTWAEKDGTVTNSERRISRVNAVLPAFGECKNDWQIAVDIARLLEKKLSRARRKRQASMFDYETTEAIWLEHRALTKGRDLDISGLSYQILATEGPAQWPYPEGATTGTSRLYEDGRFPTVNGKARFMVEDFKATAESTTARYPIALTTGRLRDQWHGMSRTGTIARLFAHAPKPTVEINAADAQRLDLREDELVYVTSARGVQVLPVSISQSVRPSQAFIAMHWGPEYVAGHAGKSMSLGVNGLTNSAYDPVSEQPELKFSAVKMTKANLPWHLRAFAWFDEDLALTVQSRVRTLLPEVTYASCVLFGRDDEHRRTGVHLTMAATTSFEDELIHTVLDLFNLSACTERESALSYKDQRRGIRRQVHILHSQKGRQINKVFACGGLKDIASANWLMGFLEQSTEVSSLGRLLLAPSDAPPMVLKARGRVICNCLNVAQSSIVECLQKIQMTDPKQVMAALQSELACGTACGSCIPEIKQMMAIHEH